MAWVKIDVDEMSRTSAQLQEAALELENTASRIGATSCCSGLGRHTGPLQAEAGALAANLRSLCTRYRELALEAILRAMIVALQEQIARNPTAMAVGAATSVAAGPAAWRPLPPSEVREMVRKGWLDPSWLVPAPSASSAALGQRNLEQMNNNMVTAQMVKRLDGMQAVSKLPGFEVTRADAIKYQSSVSSMGFEGKSYNSTKFR